MTREQKKKKLANAVRAYRGQTRNGRWVRLPEEQALGRVRDWLDRLNLPIIENLNRIDAFASYDEFNNWIKDL